MIIIIDNYDSFTYNLYQAIAPFYSDIKIFRHDKIRVSEIHQLNPKGILLSPGPKRPEEAGICIELIQSIQRTPLLGICLGHQALTVAFGGKVIQAPEIIHGKSDEVFHQKTSLYENMPQPFLAGRYHSLIADRNSLPSDLIIEAENKDQMIMGIKHKSLPLYGVQFHPESILTPEGVHLLEAFVKLCQ